jgi:hypothetical protein
MRAFTLRWTSTVAAIALAAATLGPGCARQLHRRDGFGAANHRFFDRQAEAAAAGPGAGLDSEEAAIIPQRYREALGARAATARDDPRSSVLILQEDGDAARRRP